jgi:hypothetical protein
LGDAEQFFLEISSIPRYQSRLQAIYATWQFDSNVEEQRRLIRCVSATCEALKTNGAIPEILKTVLMLGNALNEGTARGIYMYIYTGYLIATWMISSEVMSSFHSRRKSTSW